MNGIVEFLLASLIFHSDYLYNNLDPSSHVLFSIHLIRENGLISKLKPFVESRIGIPQDRICSIGLAPH